MNESALLASVRREAGITRVADLTGLDCVGIPVWQAVRPLSRALSVHQGKGLTAEIASRGAIMEAVECYHAESWRPRHGLAQRAGSWLQIAPRYRAGAADDFASTTNGFTPDRVVDWVEAEPLDSGEVFFVPERCVSLDCTRLDNADLCLSSSGQAAHSTIEAATLTGLLELVERDATTEWLARPSLARAGTEIDTDTVAFAHFKAIADRLAAQSIGVRLYSLEAIIPIPTVVAVLATFGGDGTPHHRTWGSASALTCEGAVLASLLEALQSRCTEIAGSRDTIPLHPERSTTKAQFGGMSIPRSPAWNGHPFVPDDNAGPGDCAGLIEALRSAGYRVGRLTLSPPQSAAVTIKAFVPGLANDARRRRAA